MAFWNVISVVFILSEARAQHGNSFPGYSPPDYRFTAAGEASSDSGNNNYGSPSGYGNENTGKFRFSIFTVDRADCELAE